MNWFVKEQDYRFEGYASKLIVSFVDVKDVLSSHKDKLQAYGIGLGACVDVWVSIHLKGRDYAKKTCGKYVYYRALRVFKELKISVLFSDVGLLARLKPCPGYPGGGIPDDVEYSVSPLESKTSEALTEEINFNPFEYGIK